VQGEPEAWTNVRDAFADLEMPSGWIGYWKDATLHWQSTPTVDGPEVDAVVPLHDLANRNAVNVQRAADRLTATVVRLAAVAKALNVPVEQLQDNETSSVAQTENAEVAEQDVSINEQNPPQQDE
jgi:hypothetical protein